MLFCNQSWFPYNNGMKLFLTVLAIFAGQSVLAQTNYVPPTRILEKKGYQIGILGEAFISSKSIDDDNEDVKFKNGEAFKRFQGEFSGLYGLTENLQIGGGLRYRQNSSTRLDASEEKLSETSTGVESTFVSLKYAFKPVDRLYYSLEGLFRYTPFTNDENQNSSDGTMILGDDGNEYSIGLGMTYAFKSNNFFSGRAGYRKPGQELSDEIYWQLEGALAWRYLALVAGIDGVNSMNNDPHGDESDATRPSYYTGRTALYNSKNREWMAPYAGINVALGQSWRIEARASQVVSGRSTDLGTTFGISLIRRVEDKKTNKIDTRFKDYDVEASISKISPKKGYVVIDKGLADDVQKGMRIDFFEFDYVGGNILLARGVVIQSKSSTAIVKITHRYNTKKELKEGTVARGNFR